MVRKLLLLGILMEGKAHGYSLYDYVEHVMSFYKELKKSTAYYLLDKLEEEGYVTHEKGREGNRPEKTVYKITARGKEHFFKLLRESLGGYTQTSYGDDIGIAFINRIPKAEVAQLLAKKRQCITGELSKFRQVAGHGGGMQYVIDHNIVHLEADLKWIDGIIRDIEKADS